MTRLLADTSVLVKWFHSEGEQDLAAARTLRAAHQAGDIDVHMLDLALYELGNVLVRGLGWSPRRVADQLDDLLVICGTPLVPSTQWLRAAAGLATRHRLSFYDAAWAAAARGLGVALVSADARLQRAGLAESCSEVVGRLRLAAG